MKKHAKAIIIGAVCAVSLVLLTIFVLNYFGPVKPSYIKKLEGKRLQLIVNNSPYIIKGMVYSPVPIGKNHTYDFWSDPLKPHLYDGRLMKAIGVNTIRVYNPGKDVLKTKDVIRDFYNKFKIRVAMGHWLCFWDY